VYRSYKLRTDFTSICFCCIGTSSKGWSTNWNSSLTPGIKIAFCVVCLTSVFSSIAVDYATKILHISLISYCVSSAKSFTCSIAIFVERLVFFKTLSFLWTEYFCCSAHHMPPKMIFFSYHLFVI